jgi:CBS domain-containing protein
MARFKTATVRSGSVGSTVQALGSALARQAESAGEHLQTLASAYRDALPRGGAAALMSNGLDSARTYFRKRDLRDVGQDLVDFVRRYPLRALFIGTGAVYAISRLRTGRRASARRNGVSGARLKDVMTRRVEVIRPDATLKEAAEKMSDIDVGAIPVCDGDRLIGMLTDRDIAVRAVARGAQPSTPVREIMSSTVRYAFDDEPVEQAMETMKRRRIRRLPVVDREKRLMGIVSLGDLAVEADSRQAGQVLERVSAAPPTH